MAEIQATEQGLGGRDGASFLKLNLFIYFWLCWVFIAVHRLSLAAVNAGYSLVVVFGLLIAVASLVAEHRLQGTWAQ